MNHQEVVTIIAVVFIHRTLYMGQRLLLESQHGHPYKQGERVVGYVVLSRTRRRTTRTLVLRATQARNMYPSSLPACGPSAVDSPHPHQPQVARRIAEVTASTETANVHVLLVGSESESGEKSSRSVRSLLYRDEFQTCFL